MSERRGSRSPTEARCWRAAGSARSAASCVSLARALNATFELGLSIEEINHVGWEGEFAYHGIPSGVDNTASTYGGLLVYRVRMTKNHSRQIEVERAISNRSCQQWRYR